MTDHDRLFKELLSTFFLEFVDLFLPDAAVYLERDSLSFLDKELFTDVTAGERYEADLVVRAQFRGQLSCFLIHLEHQAQPQRDFGQRMFRYFARLSEQYALPVYPVVLFSYDAPRQAAAHQHRVEFPGWMVLEFNYRVIQLNRLHWQEFVARPSPVSSALMAKMGMEPQERPRVKLECLRMLAGLELDPARTQLISGFVDTYLELEPEEERAFEEVLGRIEPERQEQVMQIVTSWMRQGIQQGRQEGQQEGRKQEALTLILRQLARRLGTLAPELNATLQQLSVEQLEELAEALLDFSAMADLSDWLCSQNLPQEPG